MQANAETLKRGGGTMERDGDDHNEKVQRAGNLKLSTLSNN